MYVTAQTCLLRVTIPPEHTFVKAVKVERLLRPVQTIRERINWGIRTNHVHRLRDRVKKLFSKLFFHTKTGMGPCIWMLLSHVIHHIPITPF